MGKAMLFPQVLHIVDGFFSGSLYFWQGCGPQGIGIGGGKPAVLVGIVKIALDVDAGHAYRDVAFVVGGHLERDDAAQHQAIMRQFVADAEVVELDSNGRFLMNKRKLLYYSVAFAKSPVRFVLQVFLARMEIRSTRFQKHDFSYTCFIDKWKGFS